MNALDLICRPENNEGHARRQRSIFAFLMGSHPRLGENSVVLLLDILVLDLIAVTNIFQLLNRSLSKLATVQAYVFDYPPGSIRNPTIDALNPASEAGAKSGA